MKQVVVGWLGYEWGKAGGGGGEYDIHVKEEEVVVKLVEVGMR